MNVIGDLNVTEKISGLEMEATILYIKGIQFSDGTTLTSANGLGNDGESPGSGGELPSDAFEIKNGKLHINLPVNFEESANFINCGITSGRADLTGVDRLDTMTMYCANINPVYDGSGIVTIQGNLVVDGTITSSGGSIGSSNGYAYDYLIDSNCKDKTVDDFQTYVKVMEGTTLSNGNVNFGSVTLCAGEQTSFQRVAVCLHFSQDTSAWTPYFGPGYGDSNEIDLGRSDLRWKTIYATNSLNTCDIKYKENIIYLDDLLDSQTYSLNAQAYSSNEVETPFLDFIKNDFKPALYNYKSTAENGEIRQQDNQLGFIANDIIDTEIGGTFLYDFGEDGEQDIMVSASGYTTVVARALQEEIRTRDEKIASLEARLAKIEEMLGINNN